MLTQFAFGMASAAQAKSAAGQLAAGELNLPEGSFIAEAATQASSAGDQDDIVVVTVLTATPAVDVPMAQKYLHYLHADLLAALLFR
ncbi:hypothetical protein [Nocardia callitridis]|uniref:Uncharacterized protein n=1 Tax=Nocardia callitridis TaxID=648753 RepID=A0ABP9K851_9NOCA